MGHGDGVISSGTARHGRDVRGRTHTVSRNVRLDRSSRVGACFVGLGAGAGGEKPLRSCSPSTLPSTVEPYRSLYAPSSPPSTPESLRRLS